MQKSLYSRAIAAMLAVFVVTLGALPAQAAQKKPVKAAHGKAVAAQPAVKKGHTATASKATATKPASHKRAGARPVPKPTQAVSKASKAPKKPSAVTGAKVGGRKAHAAKAAGAGATKGKKPVLHRQVAHKPAVKHTAKPRKAKKTAH